MEGIQQFYDMVKPTNKKVLQKLDANPLTDSERDAVKFLQRYLRGLDNSKLLQFLRFTTASDIMIDGKLK
jgi:hypothetical protein